MGLAREIQPFIRDNVWPLVVLAVTLFVAIGCALFLRSRRDLGSGLFPARRGPASAKASLSSAFGLAFRQQRGLIIGWSIGVAVLAVALGSMAQEVAKMTSSSKDMAEMIALLGGSENLTNAYLAFSMSLFGVMAVGYAVQAMQKIRSEEAEGRLELVLAGSVRRQSWILSHMVITAIGGTILVLIAGVAAGVTHGIMSNDLETQAFALIQAGLVQIPLVLLFVAIVAFLFAVLPAISNALAWTFFAGSYAIMQLGALLKLPEWAINLSPFTHIPALPAEEMTWSPVVWLLTVAVGFAAVAIVTFRHRDITTA
jgi:ABC-2 type transport system permease protein